MSLVFTLICCLACYLDVQQELNQPTVRTYMHFLFVSAIVIFTFCIWKKKNLRTSTNYEAARGRSFLQGSLSKHWGYSGCEWPETPQTQAHPSGDHSGLFSRVKTWSRWVSGLSAGPREGPEMPAGSSLNSDHSKKEEQEGLFLSLGTCISFRLVPRLQDEGPSERTFLLLVHEQNPRDTRTYCALTLKLRTGWS